MCKRGVVVALALMVVFASTAMAAGNDGNKVKLNYILLSEQDTVPETSVIKAFNASHSDVEVIPVHVEFVELDKQILLSAAGGGDLDIMQTNHSSVPQFVSAGLLEPLDGFIKEIKLDLSTYQHAAVKIGNINGVQYAIPYNPDCRVFVYNKKMLDDIHMAPPKTMDDLLKIGAALKKMNIYAFAGEYTKNWFPIYDFGCFMLGNGGHIYELRNGKYVATANSPAVVDFVKWSKSMFQYMPKDYSIKDDMLREFMFQDKVAMMWFGPWEFGFFDKYLKQGKFGLSLIPAGKVKSGSSMGGWMLGINSFSRNKDKAKEFLAYVNQPQVMAKMASSLPADSRSFQYPPFNDPKYRIFNEQFKTAEYPAPPTPVYPVSAEIFNSYYQKAVTGALSVEEACKRANAEIQKELDNM
jgi:multiple sugar transport system substrate-binding protein